MQKILGQVKVDLPYQEWNFHPNMLENLMQLNLWLLDFKQLNLVLNFKVLNLHIPYS